MASASRPATSTCTWPTLVPAVISACSTSDGTAVRHLRRHAVLSILGEGGVTPAADGMKCDIDGNIWAGARPGVQIVAPDGAAIGMIRLPENCANVTFGGARRNRLFMTASQSLYAVYVETQGANPA